MWDKFHSDRRRREEQKQKELTPSCPEISQEKKKEVKQGFAVRLRFTWYLLGRVVGVKGRYLCVATAFVSRLLS